MSGLDSRGSRVLLLASVFTIATCGLVYELIAGTLASYLLGDSVTQFSTVIGVYLFAMGVGSWLSKWVKGDVLAFFIRIEFLIGIVGGFSALVLFALFSHVASFRVLLYGIVFLTGTLVGLEIPLLLRLLKDQLKFEDLVSRVLSLDYIGALAASLLFPLVLVPKLGLVLSSFLFGLANALVGLMALVFFREQLKSRRGLWISGILSVLLLTAGAITADRLMAWAERSAFDENIIFARSSPYQRLVLTRRKDDVRLYLNGNLQFSSRDEYRYHEALVHPAMARLKDPQRVLILGGGDGFAAREVLRYPSVNAITLVDLDPEMTKLFRDQELLARLNDHSLSSPKLTVINRDAFGWIEEAVAAKSKYDAVIIDFPDPSGFSLGKLFSLTFYQRLRGVMADHAVASIQCTSPLVARRTFWCVGSTLEAAGFSTLPHHVYVPSFGEWGFMLASIDALQPDQPLALPESLRFLTQETYASALRFPPDMTRVPVEVNRLNNQILVRYFEEEWRVYE
jgi:spermidine synthase